MTNRTYMLLGILLILIGMGAGYAMAPSAETKIETVEVEKIREKVKTVTVVVEKPGGERITTIKEDRSTDTDSGKESKIEVTRKTPDWQITASYAPVSIPVYGLAVQRRILGNIWGGGYGRTDGEIGVLLSFEF